jgi:hypothetical protein
VASNVDGSAEALCVFTQAGIEWIDSRSFNGEVILLDDGCPNGANVGVSTHDREEVSLTGSLAFSLANKPVQSKPDSRAGVFHPFRVFQHPEAFVGILHDGCPFVIGEIVG